MQDKDDEEGYIKFPYPYMAFMTLSHRMTTPDVHGNQNALYNMEFIYVKNTDPDYVEIELVDMFETLDTLIDIKNVREIRPRTHEELRSFVMFFAISLVVFCSIIALVCFGSYISHKIIRKKEKRKVMWKVLNNELSKKTNELSTIREENSE